MNLASRIYRRLAQAFPHEFKVAYGADVTQLGEDVMEESARRLGTFGLIRLLADIAIRVPLEYWSEVRADLRYAARGLIKSPGFTLVGIISMGLGIGLTTNMYNSKFALLSRDLPAVANAKRLVMAQQSADTDLAQTSYYYIEQYREQKSLFSGVAAFQTGCRSTLPSKATGMPNPNGYSGNWCRRTILRSWASKPSVDACSALPWTSLAIRP
jgi:hypothetical protein